MTNSIETQTERFTLLPDDARTAIQTFDYDTALKDIHSTHKLHIDQAASLEKAVADVIFGDMHTNQLVSYIEKELRLDPGKAIELALDVNAKILLPIQENMRKIQTTA